MTRFTPFALFALILIALATPLTARAQSDPERADRIKMAYILSFGRPPAAAELQHWMGRREKDWTVSALVENNRNFLKQYAPERRNTIIRSYQMAMGRDPAEREISDHWNRNRVYSELLQDHVAWMKSGRPWIQGQGDALKDMVDRAYKSAGFTWYWHGPGGSARKSGAEKTSKLLYDDGDIDYWKDQVKKKSHTFGQLVVMHLRFKADYCKKSIPQPATRVGTVVTQQAQGVANGRDFTNQGVGVVAMGGANVVAVGGANVVAMGGNNVVAMGGANLVVLDGKPYGQ